MTTRCQKMIIYALSKFRSILILMQQQYYNAGTVTIWISRKWEIAIWILILRFIFERLIRFLFMKHNLQNIRLQYALFQLANIHSHK